MESSLDTRLHSNKVLISSSSVSAEEDEEDEPSYENLEEKPGSQPGCYEEQLMMMMVELGRTSAVRPGSSEPSSHQQFLTLFLSPTTSPSSSCHHLHHPNLQEHSPPLKYLHRQHHPCRDCDRRLSKTCIPNSHAEDRLRRRFRFLGIPTTVNIPNRERMMTSF